MNVYGLIFLKRELILNKRKNILEFGSGLSTIFLALVIKRMKLEATITTIESDSDWVSIIEEKIFFYHLEDIITIVYAPLVDSQEEVNDQKWYNPEIILNVIKDKGLFDMVVIDGPPAFYDEIKLSRYNALPFIQKFLGDSYTIFLDDAIRPGEKRIMELWKENLQVHFLVYEHQIAVSRKGLFLSSHPNWVYQ